MNNATSLGRIRRSLGFTMIELLIGLAIVGIGMTIAVPSFQGMIARNNVATQVNEMILAINLARSEATRRSASVSIRARSATTNDEFGEGWCVVPKQVGGEDTTCCNELAAGAAKNACLASIIRTFPALIGNTTLNLVNDDGAQAIHFSGLGAVENEATLDIDLCYPGQLGRRILIAPIGRAKSHKPSEDSSTTPVC